MYYKIHALSYGTVIGNVAQSAAKIKIERPRTSNNNNNNNNNNKGTWVGQVGASAHHGNMDAPAHQSPG